MVTPSIYLNLEDDVSKIVQRIKREKSPELILVCPKRCYLFSDPLHLKLLKEQTDALGKDVSFLTMDEKGQAYATEAGFQLKFLPKMNANRSFSDISPIRRPIVVSEVQEPKIEQQEEVESLPQSQELPKSHPTIVSAKDLHLTEVEPLLEQRPPLPAPEPVRVVPHETIYPVETKKVAALPKIKKPRIGFWVKTTVVLSLILILLLVFVILPKATVVVHARTEPVTRDFLEISLSPNVKEIDFGRLSLPAEKIDAQIQAADKFNSQGKKQVGNKAAGTIKIYNFTKVPINLKAGTTSLVLGGKVYTLLNDVMGVKPTTYKDARTKEVNESSLGESVQIIASVGGEDFNLPAGTRLEITNEVFGSQPQLLYAKTDTEIKGGTTRYLSVISSDDEALALNTLQDRAFKQLQDKLAKEGKVLTDKAFNISAVDFKLNNPTGTETPSFEASYKATVSGLVFKGDDLKNLIFRRIEETLAANKTLRAKDPDKTIYKIKSLDMTNLIAVMEAHFEGEAVYDLNLPYLAPELIGKSKEEANEILRSKAEIDKVEITLAPAWQKNFPFFAKQIHVKIAGESQNSK